MIFVTQLFLFFHEDLLSKYGEPYIKFTFTFIASFLEIEECVSSFCSKGRHDCHSFIQECLISISTAPKHISKNVPSNNLFQFVINFVLLTIVNNFLSNQLPEFLATLSLIITVNHFQLEIKIMIAMTDIVPRSITEPGGTMTVTLPT